MSNYQTGGVAGQGASIRTLITTMQSEHQAIIRDVLAAADFWGGTRSLVWKQFMADLGRNFQLIYDQGKGVKKPPSASAMKRELSAAAKYSPGRIASLERRWRASC